MFVYKSCIRERTAVLRLYKEKEEGAVTFSGVFTTGDESDPVDIRYTSCHAGIQMCSYDMYIGSDPTTYALTYYGNAESEEYDTAELLMDGLLLVFKRV